MWAALDGLARSMVVLLEPVGLLWFGLSALALLLVRRRRWGLAAGCGLLWTGVTAIGGTAFPDWLLRSLEQPYAGRQNADLPVCDAIVQLGGAVEPASGEAGNIHLTFAGDRILMALELARLGKAPVLCVSGGFPAPGSSLGSEADLVRNAIVERQLASTEVISLGASLDTRDEALRVRELSRQRGWSRVLLVTSAAHMRRAVATFRHHGIDVVPAPCNFLTRPHAAAAQRFVRWPTWHGFFRTAVWFHEQIGWLEYRRRGWLDRTSSVD